MSKYVMLTCLEFPWEQQFMLKTEDIT